ncbi:16S rRNA (cytosine(1402)-N(4))-methyltransferase RsmH [Candidatus Parcubacteria bacterium]|nr:16S rRNA (cytosine(1402)-N(4))-methyltransferase RsmH [Candidatus Parcubacteria bacterium]
MKYHIPVLQKEVLEYLNPKPNENFIDCTIGEAGHTFAILEKNKPNGKVLGIEIDPEVYKKSRATDRLILVNDSYVDLKKIVGQYNFKNVSGILIDLGFSSWHIEKSKKGFSFQKDEALDMRFSPDSNLTAKEILNRYSEKEIEKILKKYSQEKFGKRIAKKIIEARRMKPINTTFELVEIIKSSVPLWYQRQKRNPATKTFQALRIAVNDELNNLRKILPQTLKILKPGGKIVIIGFHSLEDRIVKNFFKETKKEKLVKILTENPIKPGREEIKINPRSRSAKLRAAIKI